MIKFCVLSATIVIWLLYVNYAEAVSNNCKLYIEAVGAIDGDDTDITLTGSGADPTSPLSAKNNLLGADVASLRYDLVDTVYIFRAYYALKFIYRGANTTCELSESNKQKIYLVYESSSKNAVNFRNSENIEANFLGHGIAWGVGNNAAVLDDTLDNQYDCALGFSNYPRNNMRLYDFYANQPVVGSAAYSTDVRTGDITYGFYTSSLDRSFGVHTDAGDFDEYYYFAVRVCTPGTAEIYFVYDQNNTSSLDLPAALTGTYKQISSRHKVNQGILGRSLNETPGGPIVAQLLVTILSGFMCWIVSRPITRTESGEVRGAVIQPIIGVIGLIFGALVLPITGHGNWFLATLLIILSISFYGFIQVMIAKRS